MKSEDLESVNRRLNRLLREQSALREIFTQINLLDVGHLLHQLAEQTLALLSVDHTQVRLLDKDGVLQTVALSGKGSERFQDQVVMSGRGRSTWVMENLQPMAIRDIRHDKIFGPGRLMREIGVKGYLCVPLISRQHKSIGVLLATSLEERDFSQEEISLAQQLAAGAAVAIENARLFEEVQKKSQELEEGYKTKSVFLNTLAHELRTPLNVLIATLQLFTDGFYGELSETQINGMEPMQRNAINLLNLINGILDLARLEAKRVPLQIEEFPLKEITDGLESFFAPLAREKGLELRFKIEDSTLRLKSDKVKIKTILENLLGNAIKYTDRGEIELRISTLAQHQSDRSEAGRLSIAVEDRGLGINESDLPHIFEAFYMAAGVNRRKYPGSGLGLSIVKRLMELLRGDIQVQSEWGKGSTFTATLPLVHPTES
ncbi:MAG: GAF domain-containing protein [Deltaproteobacteria bacterium]|nr:GAF domain-containing protein [Deltaproteobacteria bacterium]